MSPSSIDLSAPELEARIQPGLQLVEQQLRRGVSGARGLIDDLTGHLAKAGGKRLRPLLTLVAAQLGTPDRSLGSAVVDVATVMEMTHLASLYHDDVMDSAPTRRGVMAAHHVWGNNRAILAGDVLFARASQIIAPLGQEAVEHHAKVFERMCYGQLNETFGPEAGDDPVDFYLQVLADKTGSLVAASAYSGALHAGATEAQARLVEDFGEKIGVAFQIADDVLDLTAPHSLSGKTPGTDLREGVQTLPVLLLRRRAEEGILDQEGVAILEALEGDLESDEVLAEVVARIVAHPVLQETQDLAREWARAAIDALEPLDDGEVKTALTALGEQMIDRQV